MTPPKETTIIQPSLLPCPRCNNRAFLVDFPGGAKEVWCVTDRCLRLPPRETAAEAAEAWNTRALPAPVEQDVERAAKAVFLATGADPDVWETIARDDPMRRAAFDFARAALSTLTPARAEGFKDEAAIRHDERKRIIANGCIHTRRRDERMEPRADLNAWQEAQREWFDPTMLEIVAEYAEWRDGQEGKESDHG